MVAQDPLCRPAEVISHLGLPVPTDVFRGSWLWLRGGRVVPMERNVAAGTAGVHSCVCVPALPAHLVLPPHWEDLSGRPGDSQHVDLVDGCWLNSQRRLGEWDNKIIVEAKREKVWILNLMPPRLLLSRGGIPIIP